MTITNIEPAFLTGLCVRPNGSVTLPSGQPVPAEGSVLAAGEARISLRLKDQVFQDNTITHEVIVPYNGVPKVNYLLPGDES